MRVGAGKRREMEGPSLEKGRGCVGCRVVTNGCLWEEVGSRWERYRYKAPRPRCAGPGFVSLRLESSLDAFGWACRGPSRQEGARAVGLAGVVEGSWYGNVPSHCLLVVLAHDQQVAQARMDEFFAELPCCASK